MYFVANLDFVSPELIAQLDDVLKTELSTLGSIDTQQLGGIEPIADMLNLMDKNSEKNITARVEEKDPELAEEIRKLMFVFEDIIYVDDKGTQELLKLLITKNLLSHLKLLLMKLKLNSSRTCRIVQHNFSKKTWMQWDLQRSQMWRKLSKRSYSSLKILKLKAIISRGGEGDAFV